MTDNHHTAVAGPVLLGEHTVYVAFDVTATTRADAHRQVVDALRFRDDQDNTTDSGLVLTAHNVESWWLIEDDAKQFDGNDNQPGQITFC